MHGSGSVFIIEYVVEFQEVIRLVWLKVSWRIQYTKAVAGVHIEDVKRPALIPGMPGRILRSRTVKHVIRLSKKQVQVNAPSKGSGPHVFHRKSLRRQQLPARSLARSILCGDWSIRNLLSRSSILTARLPSPQAISSHLLGFTPSTSRYSGRIVSAEAF